MKEDATRMMGRLGWRRCAGHAPFRQALTGQASITGRALQVGREDMLEPYEHALSAVCSATRLPSAQYLELIAMESLSTYCPKGVVCTVRALYYVW